MFRHAIQSRMKAFPSRILEGAANLSILDLMLVQIALQPVQIRQARLPQLPASFNNRDRRVLMLAILRPATASHEHRPFEAQLCVEHLVGKYAAKALFKSAYLSYFIT